MITEADANETSGEDGLALPGSLVGESQLGIPKLEPDTTFSNRVPLELEYQAEWCALKSPSIRVSVVIIRLSREGYTQLRFEDQNTSNVPIQNNDCINSPTYNRYHGIISCQVNYVHYAMHMCGS